METLGYLPCSLQDCDSPIQASIMACCIHPKVLSVRRVSGYVSNTRLLTDKITTILRPEALSTARQTETVALSTISRMSTHRDRHGEHRIWYPDQRSTGNCV